MGWESFGVVEFYLGPLLQGQTRIAKLKVPINHLLLVLEVWDGKVGALVSSVSHEFQHQYHTVCSKGHGTPL